MENKYTIVHYQNDKYHKKRDGGCYFEGNKYTIESNIHDGLVVYNLVTEKFHEFDKDLAQLRFETQELSQPPTSHGHCRESYRFEYDENLSTKARCISSAPTNSWRHVLNIISFVLSACFFAAVFVVMYYKYNRHKELRLRALNQYGLFTFILSIIGISLGTAFFVRDADLKKSYESCSNDDVYDDDSTLQTLGVLSAVLTTFYVIILLWIMKDFRDWQKKKINKQEEED